MIYPKRNDAKYFYYISLIFFIIVSVLATLQIQNEKQKYAEQVKAVAASKVEASDVGNTSSAEGWVNKALSLQDDGKFTDPNKAIEYLNNAIKLEPGYARAYVLRGTAYDDLGQHLRAIEDYSAAIRLNPDNKVSASCYMARGLAYDDLDQYQRAIEDYSEAIRLKLDFPLIYTFRGVAYNKLNQHQEAIKDFNEYIRMEQGNYNGYYNRGATYSKLGQHQRAIEDYNEAIRLKPDYAKAYHNRGVAYLAQSNKALGCRDAQKACDLGDCRLSALTEKYGDCR